jgi:hypothetical protein
LSLKILKWNSLSLLLSCHLKHNKFSYQCSGMWEIACPIRGRKMTNDCLHTVHPFISSNINLYTLSPCTSASQYASIHRWEAILS